LIEEKIKPIGEYIAESILGWKRHVDGGWFDDDGTRITSAWSPETNLEQAQWLHTHMAKNPDYEGAIAGLAIKNSNTVDAILSPEIVCRAAVSTHILHLSKREGR